MASPTADVSRCCFSRDATSRLFNGMDTLSFEKVSSKLTTLLKSVDPEKTTTKDIFRHLTDELGIDVKRYKREIREAIGEFFEAQQEEEESQQKEKEGDDFFIELAESCYLRVVEVVGKRRIEIQSEADDEKRSLPGNLVHLSEKDFKTLLKKMEGIEWEDLAAEDTLHVDMDSERSLVIEKKGDMLQWCVRDGQDAPSNAFSFETDLSVPKMIETHKDAILAQLHQDAEEADSQRGTKRSLPSEKSNAPPGKVQKTMLPGDHVYAMELDKKVFLTVAEFKGKMRADLRRYYMDKSSGEPRPTQKGLSMDMQQFKLLVENIEDLKNAVREKNTEFAVEIGNRRRAAVSDFTGRCLVDLREYYQPKGSSELKPGKRGISFDVKLLDVLSREADAVMEVME